MVVHVCKPSTREVDAGGSEGEGQVGQQEDPVLTPLLLILYEATEFGNDLILLKESQVFIANINIIFKMVSPYLGEPEGYHNTRGLS